MKKKTNRKKTRKLTLGMILYVLFTMPAGGFVGYYFAQDMDQFGGSALLSALKMLLLLLAAAYLQTILHEGGHLICGLISKYRFCSFRIASFLLIKTKDGLSLKRYSIPGTAGQCLLAPPPYDESFKFIFYNMGGVLSNLLTALMAIAAAIVIKSFYWHCFFSILAVMGISMALTNGVPLRVAGIANDGYNIKMLRNDEQSRYAFWLQLQINAEISSGARMKELGAMLPDTPYTDIANPLYAAVEVYRVSYYCDKNEFERARELTKALLSEPMLLDVYRNELTCELIFYELILDGERNSIEKLIDKKLKKYLQATTKYLSHARLDYALAKLLDFDEQKSTLALERFEKVSRSYPFSGEIAGERELINIIDYVYNRKKNEGLCEA